jgi:hypothetical protein
MHPASTAGHRARWWPGCGAFLEAGAAIRTLVARLVTGTEASSTPREQTLSPDVGPGAWSWGRRKPGWQGASNQS